MKTLLLFITLTFSFYGSYAQQNTLISTMDFVEILNNNDQEAIHYYQNNWKIIRDMAIEKGYIHSYEILETPYTEEEPFHLILITTYTDKEQYDSREIHFQELIKEKGPLSLMNEKKPGEFRKTIFSKELVRHWD
ncbi:hypothetical protein [Zhouia amylolytica]|uniref:hypothetical protein n=1 Tax=Zhouia amylolytica TaxID=376730 RepID=UPI0020CF6450|nr:hypothetical protein [Zhouia amylolytica]